MRKVFAASAVLIAAFVCGAPAAEAAAIRAGFDAQSLPGNDDESTAPVDLGFTANFFGLGFSTVYVNNNGNVTFDAALSAFTPFDLTATNRQIIAPFFADVDTRGTGTVTYGTGTVDGRNAFGVSWINVGYFDQNTDKTNSFQLILIDRSDTGAGNFDIEFNYDKILWETGDFSGGTSGLGGDSARAGYSNGSGGAGTFFELTGSAVNGAFLDGGPLATALILNMANSNVAGRYIFQARNGTIITPQVPLPGALAFMLTGLAGATVARRRKR